MINPYAFGGAPELSATYDFLSTDLPDSLQAQWKNRNVAAQPSKNIIYNSSGLIPNEGTTSSTMLSHNAAGPNYAAGASKVTVLNTVGGELASAFFKPFNSRQLPVGNYSFRAKVKTAVPGVQQNLRYGINSTSVTTNFSVDDNWSDLIVNFTVSSASANNFLIIGSQIGAGDQNFLIDELQLYNTADTIPPYTNDGNDGHIAKPYGTRNPITKNGNYVTNSTLALLSPQFPLPKTWNAMTILMALQVNSDTTQIVLSSIADAFYSTLLTTFSATFTGGEPTVNIANVNRTGKWNNQGFIVLGIKFDATTTYCYVNEVLIVSFATPFSIQAQVFSILNRLPSTSPFLGDAAIITIWDTALSASAWKAAVARTRQRLTGIGASYRNRNWLVGTGDSIIASFAAPQGESFLYRMSPEVFTGAEYVGIINYGVGGSTLTTLENSTALPLARIPEILAGGGKCIMPVLIGRNDNGTLTSNAAVDAYWVRLKAYYAQFRALGAKVIACTPLPSGTLATNGGPSGSWQTYRLYLRTKMLAEPSAYDALADFGDPATTMGDVATCENPTYYAPADTVHPYPAGHALLAAAIKPIIQGLL